MSRIRHLAAGSAIAMCLALPAAADAHPLGNGNRCGVTAAKLDATYGWPLAPFGRQHAIRSAFGDPRFGHVERNFHFGVDLPAPAGTPVYAVAAGRAYASPTHVDVLSTVDFRHRIVDGFAYWHIAPAVRAHSHVPRGGLVGYVLAPWNHVHFAQLLNDCWVNPARSDGGLRPYVDTTSPKIDFVDVRIAGAATPSIVAGTAADIVVSAYDVPPPPLPPPPWDAARIAPTLIRWRLVRAEGPPDAWRTAVDFREFLPANALFAETYAEGTTKNHPGQPGSHLFYLDRGATTSELAPGRYRVDVEAFSSRGRVAEAATGLTVVAA